MFLSDTIIQTAGLESAGEKNNGMYKMSYPTQCVVEDCLIKVFNHLSSMGCKFPTLSKGCLSPSIATMGSIPESHKCPGTYGVLDGDVCTLTGVDIPIMVEEDGKHRKTVAIVAQDPLRDPNTLPPQVIVGTPFAFHNEVSCCKQTQVYREKILKYMKLMIVVCYLMDLMSM